jgi:hypothetical protein
MKRARKLGRRYIRTVSDVLRAAFLSPRFRDRVAASLRQHNGLLRHLEERHG